MTPTPERRSAILTPKDIDAIAEAVAERMTPCMRSCFTDEEAVLIKKWVQVMEGTGSWLASLAAKVILILLGTIAWLAVTHKLWEWKSK